MSKLFAIGNFLFALSAFFRPESLFSQGVNLGTPPVLNFSKQVYKGGTQVWSITQDETGVVWFGNNGGLLEFDGTHWRLHPLPNRTIVRSVRATPGRIYAGGQDEFGYFAPATNGSLQYHSLKALLPADQQHFGDVWNIAVYPDGVFFRTDHQVFRFADEKLTPLFPEGSNMSFMGDWMGKLLVQDGHNRLYISENGQLKPLETPSQFTFGTISSVLNYSKDTLLVTTIRNGIYYFDGKAFLPWHTSNDPFLIDNVIFCASLLPDGKIALGTALNGLAILDRQRRIFYHLNKKSGLQNNTILHLFPAEKGGLWLGLDNGIDYVDIHSAFSTIFPDGELQGTGYTAGIFNGQLYFGTNTGLYTTGWKQYYAPSERLHFTRVEHSEGQVWSLNEVGGTLLMGHHEGAFLIDGLNALKLGGPGGVWKFVALPDEFMAAGHYEGLALFQRSAAGWHFLSKLEGLNESSRLLGKENNGVIWMAHPYRGIFRLTIDPWHNHLKSDFFGAKDGLPSDQGNHLFQLGDHVVFAGETGIYKFDEGQQRFTPDPNFNDIFGPETRLRYLKADQKGNIWYATDDETGVLAIQNNALNKQVKRQPIPELNQKLTAGFQFLLPVDEQNVFVATDQGFIHFNPLAYFSRLDTTLRLVLQEVRLKNGLDSLLFGGHIPETGFPDIRLSATQNSLEFSFSTPDHPADEWIRYSHYLDGSEQGWSEWSRETSLNFNNLHPGNYIFNLKAKDQHGVESKVIRFSFRIAPPWYASTWAYIAYLLALGGIMIGIIQRQQRRFAQEKRGLVNMHQQQARHSEEAINRLQNEKLEAEVKHKNQELASATLHIVQKNEILNNIREALEKLSNKASHEPKLEKEIIQIIRMLDQDARTDEDWEQFSSHFDQVHNNFLKRLSEQYAHLSPNDYKLCAYLRLNLSSKEIAALMNISLRGVESSRYRLRKRLELETEDNLTDFLMRF